MIGFGGVARESHQAHLATYRGDDKAANALQDVVGFLTSSSWTCSAFWESPVDPRGEIGYVPGFAVGQVVLFGQ